MGVFSNPDVNNNNDEEVTLKTAAGAELLGQQTSAASLPVVIASNQSAIPATQSGTWTVQLPADASATGTIAALNAAVTAVAVGGEGSWTVDTRAGGAGWTAGTSVVFEVSADGTNFVAAYGCQLNATGGTSNNGVSGPTAAVFQGSMAGCTHFRARIATYASPDNIVVTIRLSRGTSTVSLTDALPLGSNVIGAVTQSGGPWSENITQVGSAAITLGTKTSANSFPVVIASDQAAIPVKESVDTAKLVYRCVVGPFTPPATPTDMFTITGSATKTVRVLSIDFNAVETTQGTNTIFVIKRSAANTAGTSTTPTIVPTDSNDTAATAVVRQYTANPSALGAAVGNISIQRVFTSVPGATAVGGAGYYFDFYKQGAEKGIVLRGVAQTLAVNFNGAALPVGFSVTGVVVWAEE